MVDGRRGEGRGEEEMIKGVGGQEERRAKEERGEERRGEEMKRGEGEGRRGHDVCLYEHA